MSSRLSRQRRIWLGFAAGVGLALIAVGGLSHLVLRLDHEGAEARRRALVEENVRLALWRLDAAVSLFISRESLRPYFEFRAFVPAKRPWSKLFEPMKDIDPASTSPLLGAHPNRVHLYFQIEPDGTLTSPQMPPEGRLTTALGSRVLQADLAIVREQLARIAPTIKQISIPSSAELPEGQPDVPSWEICNGLDDDCDGYIDNGPTPQVVANDVPTKNGPSLQIVTDNAYVDNSIAQQSSRGMREYAYRSSSNAEQMQQLSTKRLQEPAPPPTPTPTPTPTPAPSPSPAPVKRRAPPRAEQRKAEVTTGVFTPLWQDGELFLVRTLMVGQQRYVQGLWLDWPELSKWLLSDVRDLLPNATLTPAVGQMQRAERRLAALPAELVPGVLDIHDAAGGAPAWWLLVIAWSGVAIAVGAVGLLLWGAVELSERRGAFVSAVTHELRTPLTTFRLYTEMLSEGMVPTEERRREYIETLRREAGRLSHLVENVLSFSRIEQGRRPGPFAPVEVRTLLDRVTPGLQERVTQSGRALEMKVDAENLRVRVDAAAVEQILLNLVDNACKYATGEDARIHLEVARHGRQVVFSVRDHGPGIDGSRRRRLFEPFSKSAAEAATSAPGVGLGLALCRQLARSRGGDLKYEAAEGGGTRLSLSLPVARS